MMEWKEVELKDVVEILSSKRIFAHDYVKEGIPFYRSKEVIEKSLGIKITKPLFITEKRFSEIKNKFGAPKNGEILLSAVGERAGIPFFIKDENEFYFKDGNLIWFRNFSKMLDSEYLSYFLKSRIGKYQMDKLMIGSAQKALTIIGLKYLEINLPPIQEQKEIAKTLSNLDDKITLLHQQNETLEQMAQTLFKRWFVDFEFPNDQGQPYQSSGGKMVASELGAIPEGWEVRSFYDCCNYINGAAFKQGDYSLGKIGYPIVKIVELKNGITASTRYTQKKIDDKYYIDSGDILFSWSGSPETSIDIFIWSLQPAVLNQHTFRISCPLELKPWVYNLLKNYKWLFVFLAKQKQTTGLGHVTISALKENKIPIPNSELLSKFNEIITPNFYAILNNLEQIQTLTKLRDTLLPKLMSGEIRVSTTAIEK